MEPEMRVILCPMIRVSPDTILDGDEVYYALKSHTIQDKIHGPFVAEVCEEADGRIMLKNINGGRFFLDKITDIATFYKRQTT